MKNLFGFDNKNKKINNSAFVIRDLDGAEDSKKLEEVVRNNLTARKNASLPAWLVLPACAFNLVGLILLTIGIPDEDANFTKTHLILLIVGGVLLVLGMIVLAISYVRNKKLNADPFYQQSLAREEKLTDEALKIPETAEKIDFLVVNRPSKFPVFNMMTLKVFKENGLLCFADSYEVTAIPLSQIMTAYAINSKTRFTVTEALSKEKCVRYGIKRSINYAGQYIADSRLVVELQLNGEPYEIIVAGYNAQTFTKFLDGTTVVVQ